ncbi:Transposase type 1 [Trinorchestia longiramus]|nr:Transposase type 1 [Trinorchestia longiramus]
MVTVFWDAEGILLVDFLENKKTITALYYEEILRKLSKKIAEKRPGKLHRTEVHPPVELTPVSPFVGVIQRLEVNGVVQSRLLRTASRSQGVQAYRGAPCHPNPCAHGGLCVPQLEWYHCKCPVPFDGRHCRDKTQEESLEAPIRLTGSAPLQYAGQFLHRGRKLEHYLPQDNPDYYYLDYLLPEHLPVEPLVSRAHEVLEASFRADGSDGLLLWIGGEGGGRERGGEGGEGGGGERGGGREGEGGGLGGTGEEEGKVRGKRSEKEEEGRLNGVHSSFLAVALQGGRLVVALQTLQTGNTREPFILESHEHVADGLWHVVRVTRRHRRVLLKVDNHRPNRGRAPGNGVGRIVTDGHVWLGGTRGHIPASLSPAYHSFFRGCVDRLLVDGREVHLQYHATSPPSHFCY